MTTTGDAVVRPGTPFLQGGEVRLDRTRGLWSDAWRRLIRNRLAIAALVILCVIACLCFIGAEIGPTARYEPDAQNFTVSEKQSGPTSQHWFGTDQLGRDTFARVLRGIRVSLEIGFGTQVVVLLIGLSIGAGAALGGKWSETILMRFTDITYAFPDLLAIILVRSVLVGRDWSIISSPRMIVILAIGLVGWTTIARLVRGQMLSLAERDFVIAAQAMGATRWRVVIQHMLPNTLGPVIVAITFGIPFAIFAEAALSFIGLATAGSLGLLVADGYSTIQRNVWNVVFPAAGVAVLMLCFTFVGDGLRDALDPRTR